MARILLKGCRCSVGLWLPAGLACAVLTLCWRTALARADEAARPEADAPDAPVAPPAAPAAPPNATTDLPVPVQRLDIEAAIGPMVSFSPEYQGGSQWATKVTPGIFVRWGRLTITNASGFVTRRDDDVMRGLATDLLRTDTWRANLALRIDGGRQTQDSAALTGLADIQRTVRGRLIVSHDFGAGWGATLGASADLLGRGGGTLVDFGPSKDIPLQLGEPWQRMRISLGVAVTAADRRYMQSYFGVTAQQATVTGYTEYSPSSGLRDISAGIALRGRYGELWVGYVGMGASRLLGPALASPLTQQAASWSVNSGIAYRFH